MFRSGLRRGIMMTGEPTEQPMHDDGGADTGVTPDRYPALVLRVFMTQGAAWIMYGGIVGAQQVADGTGLDLFFHGAARMARGNVQQGDFVLKVRGERLEAICWQISRGIRTSLRLGIDERSEGRPEVVSLVIEPHDFDICCD